MENNVPKVSVIIPVYKTEDYLRKCLDSVCNQTLKDIEIICINDCSPDGCLEILKEYASKDERIKIIDFKENKGAACARNAGIDAAQGEYLGFVDSDDFIDLDFYEKLYNKAHETGADIVKTKIITKHLDGYTVEERISSLDILNNKMNFNMGFVSAIYSTKLITDYNVKFIKNCTWGEDRLFIIQSVYYANEVVPIDKPIYHYINRADSTTALFNKQKLESAVYSNKLIFEFINNIDNTTESYKIVAKEFLIDDILYLLKKYQKECSFDIANVFPEIAKIYNSLKYNNILKDCYSCTLFDSIVNNNIENFNNPEKVLLEKLKSLKNIQTAQPKVSIIVPVYRVEKYLRRCLYNLVFQTLQEIEIICINDASPDNSLHILQEFTKYDKRIKIINFKENKGVAIARNEGMKVAKGEYIGFIDSDDYVDLDFYEKLYNAAIKNNADVVKSNIYTHQLNGLINKHYELFNKIKKNKFYFNMTFFSAIYKRQLLSENNIKFIEYCIWGEERLFPILACYYCKKFYVEESAVYHYINREDSATVRINDTKLASAIYSNELIFKFLNNARIIPENYKIIATEFLEDLLHVLTTSIKLNEFDTNIYYSKVLQMFENIKYKEIFKENPFLKFQYENLKNKKISNLINPYPLFYIQQTLNNFRNNHLANINKNENLRKCLKEVVK